MKVFELINFLQEQPAGALVRVLESKDNGLVGDINSYDSDGVGSTAIISLYFHAEKNDE